MHEGFLVLALMFGSMDSTDVIPTADLSIEMTAYVVPEPEPAAPVTSSHADGRRFDGSHYYLTATNGQTYYSTDWPTLWNHVQAVNGCSSGTCPTPTLTGYSTSLDGCATGNCSAPTRRRGLFGWR